MGQLSGLRPGVPVVSADGEELGRIARCGIETFTVALGPSMSDEVAIRYEDVASTGPGPVCLTRLRDELVPRAPSGGPARVDEQHVASVREQPEVEKAHRDPGRDRPEEAARGEAEGRTPAEVTVSVETERVEVQRRPASPQESGTEPSELVIPVRREQVEVRPPAGGDAAGPDAARGRPHEGATGEGAGSDPARDAKRGSGHR